MRITRISLILCILPAIIVLLASAALAQVPNPNGPSWLGQANAARHLTWNGTSWVEDHTAPFGTGFGATMESNTVAGATDTFLNVENSPDLDKEKHVWLQYTWLETGESGAIGDPMNSNGHGSTGTWSPPTWVTEDLGGGSFRRTIEWTIRPQPASEWFHWVTVGGFSVTDVKVATVCVSVPEPSSIAGLLASGLLTGVIALRRRRR